ncbi:MerR family transcriptional regulator [Sulfurovum riftiae]|uniref:MerR family transcriptional regulator n=1 Tax=Sulfurovum riftiae TaxID=1630136 RepID=A0A151CIW6_9BACT|nr:MerR family transcriptional regulator [Sulfurovum riftiae]KYJ87478.1 MerR family transcriptional regulator [Sulfurovum riftiae]
MEYKISELVKKTGVPKSTILYYIREGLLPQAHKLKPNVHRYSDEHLELIRYISYMKENFNTGNEQLKGILQNRNQSFSSSSSMITPLMNTLSGISPDETHYTKEAFMRTFDVEAELLETLIEDGILIPLGENDFTEKEASIVNLVKHFMETGIEYDILKQYVFHAKSLSMLEHKMQTQLCAVRNDENFSTLWKIVFETLFTAKEYIFNRETYRAFFASLQNELK